VNAIPANLAEVKERIADAAARSGRPPDAVQLVAVSKTVADEAVLAAYAAGQRVFGENRVQEMTARAARLPDGCEWHLIGHLQRNKVRPALTCAAAIHSVDSEALLRRIGRLAEETGARPRILIEVNISGEASKSGVTPDGAPAVLEAGREYASVACVGLMTMAPFDAPEGTLRQVFGGLRDLRDRLAGETGLPLAELSMGMSGDFEIAIEEGATLVRVGTAIFGSRH
jgi:pyridoxal phosphate enzyme (YggS family)